MQVPLLDVRRQNAPLKREQREAFARVLASGNYILGEEVESFEEAAAKVAGARFAIGVSSGNRTRCSPPCMALGIGPGDEVICPAFTFRNRRMCRATGGPPCFSGFPSQLFQYRSCA